MRQFIRQLQKSDERTKKRWLIIFTASSTLLVVALWTVYLNSVTLAVTTPIKQNTAGLNQEKPGVAGKIIQKTVKGLTTSLAYFRNKIIAQNQFIISRTQQNFIWDELKDLPLRRLP